MTEDREYVVITLAWHWVAQLGLREERIRSFLDG
jgi:hypothetical protein